LTTGNRYGKSHIAAAKLVYVAAYKIGWNERIRARAKANHQIYRAANIAPTLDQAKIVWTKAFGMLQGRRISWLIDDVKLSPYPIITLKGSDGIASTIEARTTANRAQSLLGGDYDFFNWDEAALEKSFTETYENVLRMRLADRRGRLDITTTGQGRNEYGRFFIDGLEGRVPDLYTQSGSTAENPNLETTVEEMMRGYSQRMIQQNILGMIVDGGGGFFDIEDLEAAEDADLTALMKSTAQQKDASVIAHAELYVDDLNWHNRYPDHRYVHFWDIANTTDWTVGITLDCTDTVMRLVEFERFQKTGYAHIYDKMRERHRKYQIGVVDSGSNKSSRTYFDATGVGQTIGDTLKDIRAEGFVFTKPSKDEILTDLQSALSLRQLKYPQIPVLFDELKFYEREDRDLIQDCVMALAGAVHFGKRKKFAYAATI
jgi:hypothetical protein